MINIVCTIDNNYAQHCGVMLYSLFSTNPNQIFHIFILTESISKKNQNKLYEVVNHFNQSLEIISIQLNDPAKYPVNGHVSLATYYRLTIPDYIPQNIDKILFLDVDIVVNGNVSELWNLDVENYSHAAAGDLGHPDINTHLNMPKEAVCFNAGVMLINLKRWREKNIAAQVSNYINENYSKIKWWDQDALNAVLYNNYLLISNKWNLLYNFFTFDTKRLSLSKAEIKTLIENPVIIHFNTRSKPWHQEDTHPYKKKYIYYLHQTPWKNYSFFWDRQKRRIRDLTWKIKNKLLKVFKVK